MDSISIEGLVQDVAKKLLSNKDLMSAFQSDPVTLVTKTLGINLEGEQLAELIQSVTKVIASKEDGGILNTLKGLFGK